MPGAAEGQRVLEDLAADGRPKLLLWADSDPIIPPKVGARFAERINADPPEVIENASHFLQEDAGEEIGARIASWLSEAAVSRLLYRLGLACARRPKTVMVIWLIALIAVVAVFRIAGDKTSNDLTLPGTDSTKATNLLESDLPDRANGSVPIVLHVDSGSLETGANKQAVDATVKSLKNTDGVNSVLEPVLLQGLGQPLEGQADGVHRRDPRHLVGGAGR